MQIVECIPSLPTPDLWKLGMQIVQNLIKGTAFVIGYDNTKYYNIFRSLMKCVPLNNTDNSAISYDLAQILHNLRPFDVPSFTLPWIELITDKYLIAAMLSNTKTQPHYAILFIDFCATVSSLKLQNNTENSDILFCLGPNKEVVFNKIYKALMRLILVLIHDVPDFISSIAPTAVSTISFSFTQLHNLLLTIGNDQTRPVLLFPNDMTKKSLPSDFVSLLDGLTKPEFSSVIDEMKPLILNANENMKNFMIRAIISTVCVPDLGLMKDPQELHSFKVLFQLMSVVNPNTGAMIVNVLLDQLRFRCKETSFYRRILQTLFSTFAVENSAICEMLVRLALERASTPAPYPHGLKKLVSHLLAKKEDSKRKITVWQMEFAKNSPEVVKFLNAAYNAFSTYSKRK